MVDMSVEYCEHRVAMNVSRPICELTVAVRTVVVEYSPKL